MTNDKQTKTKRANEAPQINHYISRFGDPAVVGQRRSGKPNYFGLQLKGRPTPMTIAMGAWSLVGVSDCLDVPLEEAPALAAVMEDYKPQAMCSLRKLNRWARRLAGPITGRACPCGCMGYFDLFGTMTAIQWGGRILDVCVNRLALSVLLQAFEHDGGKDQFVTLRTVRISMPDELGRGARALDILSESTGTTVMLCELNPLKGALDSWPTFKHAESLGGAS